MGADTGYASSRKDVDGSMEELPLGQYGQFKFLTGREFPWGPGGRWRAWFAGVVIDRLAQVMVEHAERVRAGY